MKKILVTCALPYSNGPIHLGHILEHIQADIWVRHQKSLGNIVYFICADDSHGTAIILKSKELNILPELMIKNILNEHKKVFINFNIFHDIYFTTHNKLNYFYSLLLLNNFKIKNLLNKKYIYQFYDNIKKVFLPDRLLKGKCPKCLVSNQYGDVCNNCNIVYNSYDLINPISILSGSKPILSKSEHLFVNINNYKNVLNNWLLISELQNEIKNQLYLWFNKLLDDWNISRDIPYFGFKIPNYYIKNKYFYVWLDALLGYISTFKYFCNLNGLCLFEDFWNINSNCELYHFLGKDILYFHGLLWPIILDILNFRKPTGLIVHGHVLINKNKMSKSNGNFINASKWLEYFDSDSLRYYFSSKLSFKINDINLCLNDFIKTINCNFINKFINIISRISTFMEKYFNNILSNKLSDKNFYYFFVDKSDLISNNFLNFNYNKVLIEINELLNIINQYINDKQPWLIIINKNNKNKLHNFCTTIINVFKVISTYLSSIIPCTFHKIEKYLNVKLTWNNINIPILNHKICNYDKLYNYIDKKIINYFKI